uniref:Uncharacterized protein n=1 Tax=Arundo donax TaxID=35708 RepID=A0A0A9BKM6_ARUDO
MPMTMATKAVDCGMTQISIATRRVGAPWSEDVGVDGEGDGRCDSDPSGVGEHSWEPVIEEVAESCRRDSGGGGDLRARSALMIRGGDEGGARRDAGGSCTAAVGNRGCFQDRAWCPSW